MTQTTNPALQPGDKLGYYQVQQPIGSGGMATVWLGYDQLLNRQVAIKQLATGVQIDEVQRANFKREATIQKEVSANHPNLVSVFELIEEPRGLFIVMEYVDGLSLEGIYENKKDPIPPSQVLPILEQLTKALHALHVANVIHRDIKPGNIIMGKDGVVRLVDFGLAAFKDEQEVLEVGTARYMAPELFSSDQADGRADIYSLGMVAYEMLAGRDRFEENFKSILRDPRNQAMRWMKWHTNERLNAPALNTMELQVSDALSEMVERMISKPTDQRIPSAEMLHKVMANNFSAAAQAKQAQEQARMAQEAAMQQQAAQMVAANPTAELPKANRTKLYILAGVIAATVVGLGILGFVEFSKEDPMLKPYSDLMTSRTAAFQSFDQALQLDRSSSDDEARIEAYNKAIEDLQGIMTTLDQNPELAAYEAAPLVKEFSQARLMASEARVHEMTANQANTLEALDFETATKNYNKAIELYSEAQKIFAKGTSSESVQLKDMMEGSRNRSFSVLQKARIFDGIQQQMKMGELEDARTQIHNMLNSADLPPTDRDREILAKFSDIIDGQELYDNVQQVVAKADEYRKSGRYQRFLNFVEEMSNRDEIANTSEFRRLRAEELLVIARLDWDKLNTSAQAAVSEANAKYNQAMAMGPDDGGMVFSDANTQITKAQSEVQKAIQKTREPMYGLDRQHAWVDRQMEAYNSSLQQLQDSSDILRAYRSNDPTLIEEIHNRTGDPRLKALLDRIRDNAKLADQIKFGNDLINSRDHERIVKEIPPLYGILNSNQNLIRTRWEEAVNTSQATLIVAEADKAADGADPMGDMDRWQKALRLYNQSTNYVTLGGVNANIDRINSIITFQPDIVKYSAEVKRAATQLNAVEELGKLKEQIDSESASLGSAAQIFLAEIEKGLEYSNYLNDRRNYGNNSNPAKAAQLLEGVRRDYRKILSPEELADLDAQIERLKKKAEQ